MEPEKGQKTTPAKDGHSRARIGSGPQYGPWSINDDLDTDDDLNQHTQSNLPGTVRTTDHFRPRLRLLGGVFCALFYRSARGFDLGFFLVTVPAKRLIIEQTLASASWSSASQIENRYTWAVKGWRIFQPNFLLNQCFGGFVKSLPGMNCTAWHPFNFVRISRTKDVCIFLTAVKTWSMINRLLVLALHHDRWANGPVPDLTDNNLFASLPN